MRKLFIVVLALILNQGFFVISARAENVDCWCETDLSKITATNYRTESVDAYCYPAIDKTTCSDTAAMNKANSKTFSSCEPQASSNACVAKLQEWRDNREMIVDQLLKNSAAVKPSQPAVPPTPATPAAADDQVGKLKDAALKDLNPGNFSEATGLVGRAIQLMLAFIGSISIVLYVYAGILWMTAAGNSEQTGKAKQVIVWTTLGVAVMLSSYLIVSAVFKGLGL